MNYVNFPNILLYPNYFLYFSSISYFLQLTFLFDVDKITIIFDIPNFISTIMHIISIIWNHFPKVFISIIFNSYSILLPYLFYLSGIESQLFYLWVYSRSFGLYFNSFFADFSIIFNAVLFFRSVYDFIGSFSVVVNLYMIIISVFSLELIVVIDFWNLVNEFITKFSFYFIIIY